MRGCRRLQIPCAENIEPSSEVKRGRWMSRCPMASKSFSTWPSSRLIEDHSACVSHASVGRCIPRPSMLDFD
jgi:hypothetical protein